jgi:hypothetical protein
MGQDPGSCRRIAGGTRSWQLLFIGEISKNFIASGASGCFTGKLAVFSGDLGVALFFKTFSLSVIEGNHLSRLSG